MGLVRIRLEPLQLSLVIPELIASYGVMHMRPRRCLVSQLRPCAVIMPPRQLRPVIPLRGGPVGTCPDPTRAGVALADGLSARRFVLGPTRHGPPLSGPPAPAR